MSPRPRVVVLGALAVAAVFAWIIVSHWPIDVVDNPTARYARWRAVHEGEVARYSSFLGQRGVGSVVPMQQLLRLGRRWRRCGDTEFAVPPPEAWPRIVPTLQLLRQLRAQGLIHETIVASGFRPAAYNRCEGGSSGSRHLSNQALDLDLPSITPDGIGRLCAAWHRDGPRLGWGLGFYSPTEIHLDSAGFRTWGFDFHAGSSLCRKRR